MKAKFRLGPLPKTETVKLTIVPSIKLKNVLDRYSEVHAETWRAEVNAATLIPHRLETFIARDREFQKSADLR